LLGAAWYGQGLRLVDVHNARNLRQVGYYRANTPEGGDPAVNPSSNSWDVAFKGDLVYLFDMSRGVEVLRMKDGPAAAAQMRSVVAPSLRDASHAAKPVGGLSANGATGFVCPLFAAT
jgi:hypothetical protein